MQHKWAFPFLKPVDAEALGLPTYHQVIQTPMDLGSVEAGIKRGGVYSSCEEVHRDVSLSLANAKLFNPPATDVHVMAATLELFWAPRWVAICERVREVEQGMNVEKEAADKKSTEMSTRQALAASEMKCAGLMADLDQLKRALVDLKRTALRITKPMDDSEKASLARKMTALPRGFRNVARDIVAETEGAHVVPEDAADDRSWRELCNSLGGFGHVALRRLARFAMVQRRNAVAANAGWCARPDLETRVATGSEHRDGHGDGGSFGVCNDHGSDGSGGVHYGQTLRGDGDGEYTFDALDDSSDVRVRRPDLVADWDEAGGDDSGGSMAGRNHCGGGGGDAQLTAMASGPRSDAALRDTRGSDGGPSANSHHSQHSHHSHPHTDMCTDIHTDMRKGIYTDAHHSGETLAAAAAAAAGAAGALIGNGGGMTTQSRKEVDGADEDEEDPLLALAMGVNPYHLKP